MIQNKKGISLIVLVITVIVMTILAGTIVLSLSNDNIFNKAEDAVNKTDKKTIETLASTLWAEAYLDGARTKAELEEVVIQGLNGYDTSEFIVDVSTKGVQVYVFPDAWKTNITTIVDGVPIPKGFVVSPYEGENTKNGGLVIYELDAGKTEITPGETHYDSLIGRNQYVWVPVDDFENQFGRQDLSDRFILTKSDIGVVGYWEVILDSTNMPDVAKNTAKSSFMTVTTPSNGITNTLAEVQAMYASVKEYGGFYIARYEAGLNIDDRTKVTDWNNGVIKTSVHSKMNKAPYNRIGWTKSYAMDQDAGGAVTVARSMYPVNSTSNTTGVVSTLTYGVQWDRTLAWYIETGAMTLAEASSNSVAYGNYETTSVSSAGLNSNAQYSTDGGKNYRNVTAGFNKVGQSLFTTGALKAAKVNNIYDMAGNVSEWTMEGGNINERVTRGGDYYTSQSWIRTANNRYGFYPNFGEFYVGFRPSLYIKK